MAADDVQRTLGILLAKVENVERTLAKGDEHRAVVHRRVDELADDVGDLKGHMREMQATVADSKIVTDEVRAWKQRGIGALFVTGIASASIGGTIAGFVTYWWDAIMKALRSAV